MKVLLFGATGMVGQGVLRECLLDPGVTQVRTIGRSQPSVNHPKLQSTIHTDLSDYAGVEAELTGYDACFYCLGVASGGTSAEDYERITYGYTMAAAKVLAGLNPGMTFVYMSGAGADSTERGLLRWARVRGRTENALLRLPALNVFVFRPGLIQPLHGIRSRTALYRVFYDLMGPLMSGFRMIFPSYVLSTEDIGKAMLKAARGNPPKRILHSSDIRAFLDS